MKIAILSDTRLPTSPHFAGHGLGQIVSAVAEGLSVRGHNVTLFAGKGSIFDGGELHTASDERDFLRHDLSAYDCVMDNTHGKVTRGVRGLPVIQVSHDRESRPNVQAVFPSEAHALWHGFTRNNARIVYNGVDFKRHTGKFKRGEYVAYLSTFYPAKGANCAFQASRLAGVKLVMAGPTPPAPPPGADYIGPLAGEDKWRFLAGARALIFPSAIEAGPVTVLEAQAVGTPVIVSAFGGSKENMSDGLTGYTAKDTDEFAARLADIGAIRSSDCMEWIESNRSTGQMVNAYEDLLTRVAGGERW